SDGRSLQRTASSARVAACWYHAPGFTIDVNFTDARRHRFALYCLDWDTSLRSQTVEVLDANSGTALSTQTLSNFHGGRYLVWDIKGHVKIRFAENAGYNAVVSGLFFSPAAAQASLQGAVDNLPSVSHAVPTMQSTVVGFVDGQIKLRVTGEPGQRFRI